MRVNQVVSQVMGQKRRRTKHTSAEEAENNNGIKYVYMHFLLLVLMMILFTNAPPRHLYPGRMRFLDVGALGCQLTVRSSNSTSFLLEFTYLFIRLIRSDEPS